MGIHARHPALSRMYLLLRRSIPAVQPYILPFHGIILCLVSAACFEFKAGPIPAPFSEQPVSAAVTSAPFSTLLVMDTATPDLNTAIPLYTPIIDPVERSAVPVSLDTAGTDPYHRITMETLTFTIPEGWTSCANIAAYFGITLEALYTANPDIYQYGYCVIHTGQVISIPPVEVHTPTEYVNRYACIPSGTKVCLQPDDPLVVMVGHTLFGEGGSTMGPASAANIMQVALNRLNNLLEHRGVAVSDLTRDEFQQLLIHILAQPYRGKAEEHPVFNAFAMPFSHPQDPEQFQNESISRWNASLKTARNALENGRESLWWSGTCQPDPRIADPANQVLYYCSGLSTNPPFDTREYDRIVAVEERNANTLRSQWYYYNSSQHCSW